MITSTAATKPTTTTPASSQGQSGLRCLSWSFPPSFLSPPFLSSWAFGSWAFSSLSWSSFSSANARSYFLANAMRGG